MPKQSMASELAGSQAVDVKGQNDAALGPPGGHRGTSAGEGATGLDSAMTAARPDSVHS